MLPGGGEPYAPSEASVVVNIVLDLILVPMIGVVGPALATFGQSLVGTLVLSTVVLGRGATLRLLAVCAPVIATTMLFAIGPDDVGLAAISVVAAIGTGVWALTFDSQSGRRSIGRAGVDSV